MYADSCCNGRVIVYAVVWVPRVLSGKKGCVGVGWGRGHVGDRGCALCGHACGDRPARVKFVLNELWGHIWACVPAGGGHLHVGDSHGLGRLYSVHVPAQCYSADHRMSLKEHGLRAFVSAVVRELVRVLSRVLGGR